VPDDTQPDGIKKGPAGTPLRRPPKTVPKDGSLPGFCVACPKYDAKTGTIWPGFTPENRTVFQSCRACIELGHLPRAGGIEDQEPGSLEVLMLLKAIKAQADVRASQEREERMIMRLFKNG